MATTSIIVELLIIGFFTSIWIFLWCLRLSLFDIESIKQIAFTVQSTPVLLVISALSYQLGVIMNSVSHKLTKRFAQSRYRDQIVPGVAYEAIRAKVRQQGSENINRILTLHLSFVRLTRAGIINFFLIAAGMISFGGRLALAGIMPLLLSLLCVVGWRSVYRGYYRRMAYAYQEITGQPVGDSLFKE